MQRRQAPFPPRSDHLQLLLTSESQRPTDPAIVHDVHLIIGGYNGSHYLNDVWLAVQVKVSNALPSYFDLPDFSWTRMADAPFTPRSSMMARQPDRWWLWRCALAGARPSHPHRRWSDPPPLRASMSWVCAAMRCGR